MIAKFQYISSADSIAGQKAQLTKALTGGVRWIQMRMKQASAEDIAMACLIGIEQCKAANAIFVLNDYVTVAKSVGADGVHIGLEDHDQRAAREMIGPDKILGVTAHSLADIRSIHDAGVADYIHLGPFRYTKFKGHAAPILGVDGYWKIMQRCRQEGLRIPILALGGIALKDVRSLLETGVHGIAATALVQETADLRQLMSRMQWYLHGSL